jgi:hypothetical protein
MAHFAQLDETDTVIQVIVVNNEVLDSANEEASGIEFCQSLYGADTRWLQTSYNRSFRSNFAAVGYTYDKLKDEFVAPDYLHTMVEVVADESTDY